MGKTSKSAMKWTRLLAKLSLLATDPTIRKAIGDRFTETVRDFTETASAKFNDVSESAKGGFDDASDRMQAAAADFKKQPSPWPSRIGNMMVGVGVGTVLAFLFAPAAGEDTRQLMVDTAVKAKTRVVDFVSNSEIDQPLSSIPLRRGEG
jgi:hypothetical protein